jgi:restriction system protein
MKKYYKIMLGKKSSLAKECLEGNCIGAEYGIFFDLKDYLLDDWRECNRRLIPKYLETHPGKSKIAAGLACGALWTIGRGIKIGDVIVSPDGHGYFHFGEVTGDYEYKAGEKLPHQRKVRWLQNTVARQSVSQELKSSTNSQGTAADITKHAEEIERYIAGQTPLSVIYSEQGVEDPTVFMFEKHLEDFLVQNWKQTELGKDYDIYEENGELAGQQYPSDTGPIDILAISKDKKTLLVVELKRGRVSDAVVGQIQRYMGYVKDELADKEQEVKGVIIGLDDDVRIKRALSVTRNIDFFKYEVSFKLHR